MKKSLKGRAINVRTIPERALGKRLGSSRRKDRTEKRSDSHLLPHERIGFPVMLSGPRE